MSIWARVNVKLSAKKLKNNETAKKLLIQAVKDVIKELTGRDVEVKECGYATGWAPHPICDIWVVLPHMYGNGFGIVFNEGTDEVEFVGDTHGLYATYKISLEKLAELIVKRYVELTIDNAMRQMGYIKAEQKDTEHGRELVYVRAY
jgi:hypothetical protein